MCHFLVQALKFKSPHYVFGLKASLIEIYKLQDLVYIPCKCQLASIFRIDQQVCRAILFIHFLNGTFCHTDGVTCVTPWGKIYHMHMGCQFRPKKKQINITLCNGSENLADNWNLHCVLRKVIQQTETYQVLPEEPYETSWSPKSGSYKQCEGSSRLWSFLTSHR